MGRRGTSFSRARRERRSTITVVSWSPCDRLQKPFRRRPIYTNDRLAAVGVQFGERYAEVPGMLYMLLQRVALQNVNLVEITSTYTEIVFFVDEADTQLVFDVLFRSFVPAAAPRR